MINIHSEPQRVLIHTDRWHIAEKTGEAFVYGSITVCLEEERGNTAVNVIGDEPVKGILLRYKGEFEKDTLVLGDDWERAYANLGFRPLSPERALPWYFLASNPKHTDCYGVMTAPAAFCSFFASNDGIEILIDVRNGGNGVQLHGRKLKACVLTSREGRENESAFKAGCAFCKQMCPSPRLPQKPVYGSNNWYYAYGNSSHGEILSDTDLLCDLTSGIDNRPFMVIDDGWQVRHGGFFGYNGGPWDRGNERFPNMPRLAEEMSSKGVRPGIWIRALHFKDDSMKELMLSRCSDVLDPTRDEVKAIIQDEFSRIVSWGFEMIKHDFSTVDITGKFGMWMNNGSVTEGDWSFYDNTRTTAEIILDMYKLMREASGNAYIIGCNTISHLSAGVFELQRTGDDTSGHEWHRTRQFGVNTVAFRSIQHNAFYAADGDCVGVTDKVDWNLNKRWLELLSKSGTPLFVSPDPKTINAEKKVDIRRAFEIAAVTQPLGEPLDWRYNDYPNIWKFGDEICRFDWMDTSNHHSL